MLLVQHWMTEEVITLDENESVIKAIQILKEFKIRRIPITKNGKLIGIITISDIREATPSKITAFDIHEFYYLLSEIKVKDIMTKDPIVVYPDDTVEYAAVLMLENKISGLPVINKDGFVVGIITQTDIFKIFVNITGVYQSPYQVSLIVNSYLEIKDVLEIFEKLNIEIYSLLSWKDELCYSDACKRRVFIRFKEPVKDVLDKLHQSLNSKFEIITFRKDNIERLPRKLQKLEEEISIF